MRRLPLYIFILFSCLTIVISCKKYPENKLWFKKPEKAFKGGYLTAFNVNGVDSLPMWDNIYNTAPDYNGWGYPFNIRDVRFNYDFKEIGVDFGSKIGNGTIRFVNKKKEVEINFTMTSIPSVQEAKYNIFLTKLSAWKILKLTKSGTMKLQRNYNNKIYVIQIN